MRDARRSRPHTPSTSARSSWGCCVASALEWQDARRLARYVRQGGRCGLHRDDADRMMGWTIGSRRRAFGLAYSQGWIDVCGAWLVTPPKRLPLDPAVYRL